MKPTFFAHTNTLQMEIFKHVGSNIKNKDL